MLDYAPLGKPLNRWGKGFMALSASVLLLGLGQFCAGRRRRGILWVLATVAIGVTGLACLAHLATPPVAAGLTTMEIALAAMMLIDAFISGRQSNCPMLGRPWLRYLTRIGCLLTANFANPRFLLGYYFRDHDIEAFVTNSGAMSPTLMPSDTFLAHKGVDVQRYSLIVFQDPEFGSGTKIVSRIVGLPGETVEIVDGQLHVDGRPISPRPA
ncbi:MAG: signal peptidase I [Phycisphaerae bacterium]